MFRRIRLQSDSFTVQQMQVLVDIGLREGTTVGEVAERLDVSLAGASRNIDILANYGRRQKNGLGLIERRDVLEDRRVKELHLTTQGRRLVGDLLKDVS